LSFYEIYGSTLNLVRRTKISSA